MWTSTLELDPAHFIPTKILGLVWRGAYFSSFAPLQVRNLPRQPLPASNWVRVRNSLAGICGSDLHLIFLDGDFSIAPAALPNHSHTYPGHEVVGEVIEVGDDVQQLRVGDRVVLQHGPNCVTAGMQQICRSCASGNYGLCEYGVLPGPQPVGGGWSEEMLLHEGQLFRVPASISDMQAVLLEPSAVAVHAVLRRVPRAGDRIFIIGAGTIGLLILQVVRALAPEAEVYVLARHAFQVEQAARMGAQIIYPQDSYQEVQRATGAQLYQGMWGNRMLLGGYDVIYDTVGTKRTTHDSLRWARAGATVVMVGLSLHQMHIDLTPIWYQEINLIGTTGHGLENWPTGTSEQKSSFEIAAELIEKRQIFPEKLITHSFSLNGYRNALLTAADKRNNRAIKVIFDFSKQPPSVVPNVRAAGRQRQRVLAAPPEARLSQPLTPAPDEQGSMYPQEDISFPPEAVPPQWTHEPPEDPGTIQQETHEAPQPVRPAWMRWAHEDPEKVHTTTGSVPTSDEEIPTGEMPVMQNSEPDIHQQAEIGGAMPVFPDEESAPSWLSSIGIPADEGMAESPLFAPPATGDQDDVQMQSAAPAYTGEDEDDPKTVVVFQPKRGRIKRKTGATQATRGEEDEQTLPVTSENQEQSPEAPAPETES